MVFGSFFRMKRKFTGSTNHYYLLLVVFIGFLVFRIFMKTLKVRPSPACRRTSRITRCSSAYCLPWILSVICSPV